MPGTCAAAGAGIQVISTTFVTFIDVHAERKVISAVRKTHRRHGWLCFNHTHPRKWRTHPAVSTVRAPKDWEAIWFLDLAEGKSVREKCLIFQNWNQPRQQKTARHYDFYEFLGRLCASHMSLSRVIGSVSTKLHIYWSHDARCPGLWVWVTLFRILFKVDQFSDT